MTAVTTNPRGREPLRFGPVSYTHLGGRLVSRGGLPGLNIRSGWGRASCCRRSAQSGFLGEGAGSKRMSGNGVRVSPVGTDVTGVFVLSERVVCRCVSTADSSLSLSLSLCSRFPEPQNGSNPGLLAGSGHALGRGFRRSSYDSSRLPAPHPTLRLGWGRIPAACDGTLRLPPTDGTLPSPTAGRRTLFAGPACRGLFERHVSLPNGALAFEEVPSRTPIRAGAGRRGPSDPWVTAPPFLCFTGGGC